MGVRDREEKVILFNSPFGQSIDMRSIVYEKPTEGLVISKVTFLLSVPLPIERPMGLGHGGVGVLVGVGGMEV